MKNELRIHVLSGAARDPKFNPAQFVFPLRVVVDNVGLTISHSSRLKHGRPYESYTVCYRDHDRGRKRIPKADFNDAVKVAVKVAGAINAGQMDTLTLTNAEKRSYLQAVEMLRPLGVPLEVAVADYVKATGLTNGHSLTEAARFFASNNLPFDSGKTVPEVIRELISLKKEKKKSKVYINDLTIRLGDFADYHQGPISEVTTERIESFLRSLGLSPRSVNNYRLVIGTLLGFARKRGYLPKGHPGVSEVEKSEETPQDEHILSPDQMAVLLANANRTMKPVLLLGGFAGIRHAELMRLDWSEVDLKQGFITIKAAKAKTRARRLIPIAKNLRAWLGPMAKVQGPVVTVHNLSKPTQRLSLKAKIPWHSNVLRNTYISCRVALTGDPQRVAFECGNSPRMVLTNYLKLVTPDVARQYFAILPATPQNVVAMPTKNATA